MTEREVEFLVRHEAHCSHCAAKMSEAENIFDGLRIYGQEAAEIEPLISSNFDSNILRKHKNATARARAGYWSPAFMGAMVAGLVILAAMQMIAQSSRLPTFKVPSSEARLSSPAIPSLNSLNLNSTWQ